MVSEIGKELKKNYYGEYRKGMLRKKYLISLFVYETHITGTGFRIFDGEWREERLTFSVDVLDIVKIWKVKIDGEEMLRLDYYGTSEVVGRLEYSVVLPGISEMEEIIQTVTELKEKAKRKLQEKKELEKQEKQQELQKTQKTKKEQEEFFKACYQFHILEKQNPYYELQRGEATLACIYLDQEKNLNFLKIDGVNSEEVNTVIRFEQIHYYERAGAIHYVSETHSKYDNFGGRISGATFSESAALLSGLLLGPMGMMGGLMLTYKPAKIEPPSTSLHIDSKIKEIDDRSVILNYYSEQKKQYMDVALPVDSYNFMQTYLPEKKYGIVSELEKRSAVNQFSDQIKRGAYLTAPGEQKKIEQNRDVEKIEADDAIDVFEAKAKKLKIMLEYGLLTKEEFEQEKRELLDQI